VGESTTGNTCCVSYSIYTSTYAVGQNTYVAEQTKLALAYGLQYPRWECLAGGTATEPGTCVGAQDFPFPHSIFSGFSTPRDVPPQETDSFP